MGSLIYGISTPLSWSLFIPQVFCLHLLKTFKEAQLQLRHERLDATSLEEPDRKAGRVSVKVESLSGFAFCADFCSMLRFRFLLSALYYIRDATRHHLRRACKAV